MDFNAYWDKRIEANKRLFDNNPGIANFLFDECQLLYEHMTKENNEFKRLLAIQSDFDLQGYEHMRDELQALRAKLSSSEHRVKALEEALAESILHIEYLYGNFQETGSVPCRFDMNAKKFMQEIGG